MSTRIKICGITNKEDALLAVELGADALGFVFYPKSRRYVNTQKAGEICRQLPIFVSRVGVFVDAGSENVKFAAQDCHLTAMQFHGNESVWFCKQFPGQSIKAIRVKDESSLATAKEYDVDAVLLDTYTDNVKGGSGQTFDWSLAVKAKQMLKCRIILAGGLTPENVAEAIRTVQPYAVDVSSGVEASPGKKDPDKLRRFFAACKNI
jgi:phosphoribosylanthranilate isomerase